MKQQIRELRKQARGNSPPLCDEPPIKRPGRVDTPPCDGMPADVRKKNNGLAFDLFEDASAPPKPALPPLQRKVGEEVELRVHSEGCGSWMPAEYRMCLVDASQLPVRRRPARRRDGGFRALVTES